MKNIRLSNAGKALLGAFSIVAVSFGGAALIVDAAKPDASTETAALSPGGVNALVTEFSAAVSAEAQAKLAAEQANVGKPAAVRATCTDVSAMMTQLSSNSGISTKITVTPYNQPTDSFEFGYCILKAGDENISFFDEGNELSDESHRRFIINELIENLPAGDVLKIHNALTGGAKAPQP